ncbi:NTPase [Pectobacterium brasiliense]|uniref:KAP family P-loop NTPase fold protein n=1 Tax=Pectobacterium brasiliense TaxID=180957 RepID=UPI0005801AE3|nr:P-loop NTPase fold protein [Pectobacterium brasiliense]APS29277.1 hypothetical protein NC16_05860 [Pectobacterium brasiliense]KHT00611.1 hypothetical protein RC91_16240 [Pectobacterium brasiliense]MBN3100222.1 NTPase [Pectobacterium brasiliense]MBN3103442.1 NTPase [Pectobacterium brasiliense]MBN3167390.1 NTPase [Pectobacterium brasiliense]
MSNNRFNLDLDWTKEVIFSLDGENETLSIDTLDRQRYAEYLYYYLIQQENKNTVINLNAEWGSGKSYFTRRLYLSLKNHHPCIYVDAWKQDFSDDAFLTLFSSLISQLEFYAGNLDRKLLRVGESIGRFAKGVVPEIVSGLIKKHVGIEEIDTLAKTAATILLEEHREKIKSIETLKKELKKWADISFNKGFKPPIFIFIDELDRCRPDYAISLLEIVKHIFNVDGFIFIIATDTNQLQHSIKNIYGEGFDANLYLGRFFHRRFSLHTPNLNDITLELTKERVFDNFEDIKNIIIPKPTKLEHISINCSSVLSSFKLNIRDSKRNLDRIFDLLTSKKTNKKKFDYILLLTLMIIHDMDIDLFNQLTNRSYRSKPITDLILEKTNLRDFHHGDFELIIDSSAENTNIDYLVSVDGYHTHNRLQEKTITIGAKNYTEIAIEFFTYRNKIQKDIYKSEKNPLLEIPNRSEMPVSNYIKIQQATLLSDNESYQVYDIADYIDAIELAVSFD